VPGGPTGGGPAVGGGGASQDPLGGKFTLADATKGLPANGGVLVAKLDTNKGKIECKLYEDKAPNTVANFVGLARGLRPWKDPASGVWVTKPLYDGTTFHRVISGFMIQGGDPLGNGRGEPGYVFKDEIWDGAKHDRAGLLCMANRGPHTNGSQFFITDASTPHLDALGHTIFGECTPVETIHDIAKVPADPGNKPLTPVVMKTVTISREKADKPK
jgi:peptidyl-prolyl cis-trans isomerase A (cyclophilin A)